MKLSDLQPSRKAVSQRALKENYKFDFTVDRMSKSDAATMLKKVRGLMSEARISRQINEQQNSPSYMKLIFMEQTLVQHLAELRKQQQYRIMFENEEVEEAQVTLAAQEMVDSVQKMIEQVSDMLVKELPALVNTMKDENAAQQFSEQASQALKSLQDALTQGKSGLESAQQAAMGKGGDAFSDDGMDSDLGGGMDDGMGDDLGDTPDMGDMPEEPDADAEMPEEPIANIGRSKRP